MNYETIEVQLQHEFATHMGLMPAQIQRLAQICAALFIGGHISLAVLAKQVARRANRNNRIKWVRRLLSAPFMRLEWVYHPVLQVALQGLNGLETWHIVLDRTPWIAQHEDILTVSLNYRKRAIPLVWQQVPYGGTTLEAAIALLKRAKQVLPPDAHVIFHGDTEFSGEKMLDAMLEWRWDFIIAHRSTVTFRHKHMAQAQPLKTVPVTKKKACWLAHVELYERRRGGLNLLAFYQPKRGRSRTLKRTVLYLITSLDNPRTVRSLGKRRWGIEPFHRDYKSSGWQMQQSNLKRADLRAGLLIVMALCYLISVCLGAWLVKNGQRHRVDNQRQRHLSLFRMGWELIVHCMRTASPIPFRLILYQ